MPHDVDMKMEPLRGLEDEPHTVCRHVVVKTEPKLEHTWTLPPPPPSPSPSPPSTPRAAVPGVTTRSRTRSATSTTPLVASLKPRHVKTKAKAPSITHATKKLGAESSLKRPSGKRKPKGMPPGPKPDLHIEPHDLFQYAMNAKLVRESIEKKYKTTYYTVHRMLHKLLESLHLEDSTVIHLKENGKLTFNTRRLKAEGVRSWEQFCLKYM
uniref:Uncharacterized protein n=1 Tax=Chlorella vulgaris TaxID=3077 RepID=A4GUE3_CHLVU|nr:unknown [Chlorella vulgaris]